MPSLPQANPGDRTDRAKRGSRVSRDAATFSPLERETAEALDLIRPAIREDGGDVELLEVRDDGTAVIKWLGACVGCPSSAMTLRDGIERLLLERVEGVRAVEAVEA